MDGGIGYSIGKATRSHSQGQDRLGPGNYNPNYEANGIIKTHQQL